MCYKGVYIVKQLIGLLCVILVACFLFGGCAKGTGILVTSDTGVISENSSTTMQEDASINCTEDTVNSTSLSTHNTLPKEFDADPIASNQQNAGATMNDNNVSTTSTKVVPTDSGMTETKIPGNTRIWKQDKFYLSTGYNDLHTAQQVTCADEAGYNLFLFEKTAALNKNTVKEALAVCDQRGMSALISRFTGVWESAPYFTEKAIQRMVQEYSSYSSVIGYYIWDEMNASAFETGKQLQTLINQYDPTGLVLSCVYPSYGTYAVNPQELSDAEYEAYVNSYLKKLSPDTLCFDYYPYPISTGTSKTHSWYRDMGLHRKKSLELGTPFWYWYQVEKLEDRNDKSIIPEEQIRLGMYVGLAYGAKALLAWSSQGYAYDEAGNALPRFNECKTMNAEIMCVGQFLFDKTSTHIYHTGLPSADYNETYRLDDMSVSALLKSAPNDLILSVFKDEKNSKQYLLVVNKNHAGAVRGTISLKTAKKIEQLRTPTGEVVAVSASTNEIALNLEKGSGVLYVIS